VNGWSVKEIAQHLNKAESTVYVQKQRAIEILKEMGEDKVLLLLFLLPCLKF
jgi:DNA-directed RNA polymerase specialized sigma24 family protein